MDGQGCVFVGEKVREYVGRWVAEMAMYTGQGVRDWNVSSLGMC